MQNNDDENKNTLRHFLENLNNQGLPEGWRDSPIGKKSFEMGHRAGYMDGRQEAWEEANSVIDSIRNIIKLHDNRMFDEFDEEV